MNRRDIFRTCTVPFSPEKCGSEDSVFSFEVAAARILDGFRAAAFVLLLLFSCTAHGAARTPDRISFSFSSVSFRSPLTDLSFGASLAWFLRPGMHVGTGLMYERRVYGTSAGRIPASQYAVKALFGYRLFRSEDSRISVGLDVSAYLGAESVNGGRKILGDGSELGRTRAFVMGAEASLYASFRCSRRTAVDLFFADRMCAFSPTHWNVTLLGVRFNIMFI